MKEPEVPKPLNISDSYSYNLQDAEDAAVVYISDLEWVVRAANHYEELVDWVNTLADLLADEVAGPHTRHHDEHAVALAREFVAKLGAEQSEGGGA